MLGTALEKQSTAAALERTIPFIRKMLFSRLDLKLIPHLSFIFDSTPERAHRIENILRSLEPGAPGAPPPPRSSEDALTQAATKKKRRR